MSNVLDVLDQAAFDIPRASGSSTVLQCTWVYSHPINAGNLQRFRDHLQQGRLSRRIEQSSLGFGRHRWVAPDRALDIEMAAPRPREALEDWLEEQARTPISCESGPEWHLAVLPFSGGGAGVSLVISHCLTDGVGLCEAIADAALGRDAAVSWPPAASRGRWRALHEDAVQSIRDIPAVCRGFAAATRLARRNREQAKSSPRPDLKRPALQKSATESSAAPVVTVFVDADEWTTRAQSLGGTNNSLLVGVSSCLAQRAGRVAADGSVVVLVPVNERIPGDTRANAIGGVGVKVDPTRVTTDLSEVRVAVKQALSDHAELADLERATNALVPLSPQRLLKAAGDAVTGAQFNLISGSNVGAVDAAAARPDGTDADLFALRLCYFGPMEDAVQRCGGVQTVLSGTAQGRVFLSLVSYLPAHPNSKDALRQDLLRTLQQFSLNGTCL
ncbi:hypothetical protein [[Mycobacterium] wendilense]|uniref:Fatty acyl-AMP ligase FadD28 and polyketide synthase n=1 Tax=[Mycobacterium] wendilense TaxID=3064284 RepID=A0ABN9NZB3_9MYCO|nr:hypothetical protein [Mycolicibacterium sp. MU0050]CAJ1579341.1 hypothetical protein MU0050_000459 [Mycolicibacterium sp. MU0050]